MVTLGYSVARTAGRGGSSRADCRIRGLGDVGGMATHTPSSKSPKLVAVEQQVAAYGTVSLSDVQATELLPGLRRLVLDADPSSPEDARVLLSSACRFLADVAPESGGVLAGLLTEAKVARWSHVQKDAGMNVGTLKNHLARLGRLIRVSNGLPARMRTRSTGKDPEPPLEMGELSGLVECLDADVAAALVVGAGAGLVVPDSIDATVACDGTRVVTSDGTEHVVLDSWVPAARRVAGVTVTRDGWNRARAVAKRHEIALTADRLRLTWTVAVLGLPVSVGVLISSLGLTRRVLDRALPHLGSLPADTAAGWLRG